MKKVTMVCGTCGSVDVLCDAYAHWNVHRQEWVLHSTYDKGAHCEQCGGECKIVEKEIETASLDWEYADGAIRARPYEGGSDVRLYKPEKGWRASIELVDFHPVTGKPLHESKWWIIEERVAP